MQVILMDDVPKLGERGDVVRVKDGYARNFLIPRGKATPLGTGKAENLSHQKKLAEDRRRAHLKESERQAEDLNSLVLKIPVLVGEEEKLFGSVTNSDIAEALKEKGIEIDRHKIEVEGSIKALGDYPVKIHLGSGVVATPTVSVVKKTD